MSNLATVEEAAKYLGFEKIGKHWWHSEYLEQLLFTPYELGDRVYISDGVYAHNKKYTDKQLVTLYESILNVDPEEETL